MPPFFPSKIVTTPCLVEIHRLNLWRSLWEMLRTVESNLGGCGETPRDHRQQHFADSRTFSKHFIESKREIAPTFRRAMSTSRAWCKSTFGYEELTKVLDPSSGAQVEIRPFSFFAASGFEFELCASRL